MAKENNKETMVTIRIPKSELNPDKVVETVIVNGKFYEIQLGVDVEVPVEVKNILDNAGKLG